MVRQLTKITGRHLSIAEANMHFPQSIIHIKTLDKNYDAIINKLKKLSKCVIQTVR